MYRREGDRERGLTTIISGESRKCLGQVATKTRKPRRTVRFSRAKLPAATGHGEMYTYTCGAPGWQASRQRASTPSPSRNVSVITWVRNVGHEGSDRCVRLVRNLNISRPWCKRIPAHPFVIPLTYMYIRVNGARVTRCLSRIE